MYQSFSIVSQVAFLFHGIVENLNEENIQIAQCAVQSLIEMCAGNYENQELAFKGQVVISIDQILPEGFTSRAVSCNNYYGNYIITIDANHYTV